MWYISFLTRKDKAVLAVYLKPPEQKKQQDDLLMECIRADRLLYGHG